MAQPTPREMRKPDFPAVVHTYTDVLRILRDSPQGDANHLARLAERDSSNLKRDLHKLSAAGVIEHDGACWILTDKGRQWVAGQDVAEGLASVAADGAQVARWPIDKCVPNPANRTVNPATIPDMADQIEDAGDILQRLTLTPVRPDGNRMILIGERRWRGAGLLRDEGRLPAALAEGLPFDEREATEGEAALIAIIENNGREDMSPWDDALMLARAADGLGITNASELARRAGRVREGSRGGVRDVQDKLRLVRVATPEQIAAYQTNGSWDDFRDQAFQRGAYALVPKTPTLSDQVAEYGAAVMSKVAPEPDADQVEMFDAADATTVAVQPLTPFAELALVEVMWAMSFCPFAPEGHELSVLTDGYLYRCEGLSDLVSEGFLDYLGISLPNGTACIVRPTQKAQDWSERHLGGNPPNLSAVIRWRDRCGREVDRYDPHPEDDEGFFTSALNTATKRKRLLARPAEAPKPAEPAPAVPDYVTDAPWRQIETFRTGSVLTGDIAITLFQCGDDPIFHAQVKTASGSESGACTNPASSRDAAIAEAAKRAYAIIRPVHGSVAMKWLDAKIGPHAVAGVDYGNATRAQEARYAAGIDQRPAANYGSAVRSAEDDAGDDALPTIPPATTIKPLAASAREQLAEQRLERLSASLQVVMERLEPLLAVLGGDRTEDGTVAIDSDEAEYFKREIAQACEWAEDALAETTTVFDGQGEELPRPSLGEPAVPIRKSITPDFIVCLEDGRKFKSLKRHLRTRYNLSPEQYRARWKLPADYPMVAPNYAKAREDLARRMGWQLKAARS
ncbi:putative transcriptional regulator [Brevundimonas faecalis]|uniref:Transcriptional regulator n=1 Tax=Brevundimonas faecalis TaxID=947378 RepID=A0ABV2RCG2_9CAUL